MGRIRRRVQPSAAVLVALVAAAATGIVDGCVNMSCMVDRSRGGVGVGHLAHHHKMSSIHDGSRGRKAGSGPAPFFSLNSADGQAKWKLSNRDGEYKVEEAAVPGTVHLDLRKAGILKGPLGDCDHVCCWGGRG